MNTKNSRSIGIIGSGDGPTSIFISGSPALTTFKIVLILLIIVGVLYLIFKNKSFK